MRGISAVWLRNFLYFKKSIVQSFFWAAFEPILYLFAIGFSLGKSIGNFDGVKYIDFYLPAVLTTTAMMVSYFEASFGSFTKMKYQRTFATIILAPVTTAEIVIGEILWGASKGMFGTLCVLMVASAFGILPQQGVVASIGVLFLICVMFASFGLLMCSFAKNHESFTYSISGFIVPMSLFSGTYFPLSDLTPVLQKVAWILPLTHAVQAVRSLMLGRSNPFLFLNILIIVALGLTASYYAVARIRAKLEA